MAERGSLRVPVDNAEVGRWLSLVSKVLAPGALVTRWPFMLYSSGASLEENVVEAQR